MKPGNIDTTQNRVVWCFANKDAPLGEVLDALMPRSMEETSETEQFNVDRITAKYNRAVEEIRKEHEEREQKERDAVQPLQTQKHGDAKAEPVTWAVRNRLQEVGAGLFAGQWGTYKTFVVLDLSVHVIVGHDWTGEPVYRQGGVLIIAPEGASSIAARLQAAVDEKLRSPPFGQRLFDPDYPPKPVDLDHLPIEWTSSCPPLLQARKALPILVATAKAAHERFMREHDLPLVLILIDTLATAALFTDESDPAECSRVMATLIDLSKATKTCVAAVTQKMVTVSQGRRSPLPSPNTARVLPEPRAPEGRRPPPWGWLGRKFSLGGFGCTFA